VAASRLLSGIGDDIDLWDADDQTLKVAEELWTLLGTLPGVGPVTAGKLLARKRPRLVPVADEVGGSHSYRRRQGRGIRPCRTHLDGPGRRNAANLSGPLKALFSAGQQGYRRGQITIPLPTTRRRGKGFRSTVPPCESMLLTPVVVGLDCCAAAGSEGDVDGQDPNPGWLRVSRPREAGDPSQGCRGSSARAGQRFRRVPQAPRACGPRCC
jgi:hypothetical protein